MTVYDRVRYEHSEGRDDIKSYLLKKNRGIIVSYPRDKLKLCEVIEWIKDVLFF